MTEIEKQNYNKYRWFLEQVEPSDGFKVEDYYGVQFMKVKRNNTYDVRLQYDYESHPKNGSSFKVDSFEELIEWLILLESFAVDKSNTRKSLKYNPNKAIDYAKTKSELMAEANDESWD